MAQLYGPPSDGSVIPHELEDALAADLVNDASPLGGSLISALYHEADAAATDDTAGLQAAIDASAASGRVLRLTRNKVYSVSDSIRLPADLKLNGNGATIRALPGADIHPVVNANPETGDSGLKIVDLKVDGNADNQTASLSAIYLRRVTHSLFVGIEAQGGRRGVDPDRFFGEGMEFVYSDYNTVNGGTFHHNYYDGLKLRTSHYNTFTDIKCYENGRGGIQVSYEYPHTNEGVFEAGSNYNTFTGIVVTHSTGTPGGAWVPTTSGLYVHGGSFNTFANFQIFGPGQGVGVWANSSDNTWTNGVIRTRYNGQARAAIDMEGGPTKPSHRNNFSDIKIAPLSGADGKYISVSEGSEGHRFLNVQMTLRDGTGTWTVTDNGTGTAFRECDQDGTVLDNSGGGSVGAGVFVPDFLSAFSGATGAVPYGWATRWNQAGATWTEDAAGFLRLVKTGNGRCGLANLASGDFQNVEVLAKVRTDTAAAGATPLGIVLRGAGAAAAETGYSVNISETGTRLNVTRYAAGASSTPGVFPVTWTANTWQWIRAQVTGIGADVTIRCKIWADGTAEPSTWFSYTDSATERITSAGWVGAFGFSAATVDFDQIAVRHL